MPSVEWRQFNLSLSVLSRLCRLTNLSNVYVKSFSATGTWEYGVTSQQMFHQLETSNIFHWNKYARKKTVVGKHTKSYPYIYKWYNSHSEPLLKTLGLFSITDTFKLKDLKFYLISGHNNLPLYLNSMFIHISYRYTHDTRQKSMLCQLPTKPKTARDCIRHIPELINKLSLVWQTKFTVTQ